MYRDWTPELSRYYDFGRPEVRAAMDIAQERVRRRSIEYAEPTGKEATRGGVRGERQTYTGYVADGSPAQFREVTTEANGLLGRGQGESQADFDRRVTSLRQIGISRGYHLKSAQADGTRGLTYINQAPEYMVGYEKDGTETYKPVFGGGQQLKSKYADTQVGEFTTQGSWLGESKYAALPDVPRLRNGEIDYEELNRRNGHTTNSGPRNFTMRRG
jgi:hypothetical protein